MIARVELKRPNGRSTDHPDGDRTAIGKNGNVLKPGIKGVRGRPKGIPNKVTAHLRETLLLAGDVVGSDGKGKDGLLGYLVNVAKKDHRTFCGLLARALPLKVSVDGKLEVQDARDRLSSKLAMLESRVVRDPDTGAETIVLEPTE